MTIILFILKLIGIILLILLAMILLLVLLVLLIPVRYQVYGALEDETTIHAKINWLFHFVSFRVDYQEKKLACFLRILGIRIKSRQKNALEYEEVEDETDTVPAKDEMSETAGAEVKERGNAEHAGILTARDVEARQMHFECEKKSLFERIFDKIHAFFVLIKTQIQRMIQRLFQIKEMISSLKEICTDEANKQVLLAVLAEVKYLLGHFRFRKLVTDMRFSVGDPATTGQALGILAMFPVVYRYQVRIVPDFESEEMYVKGTFDIKGRMRVIHFVVSLVRLWKEKEVRIFMKKLLK